MGADSEKGKSGGGGTPGGDPGWPAKKTGKKSGGPRKNAVPKPKPKKSGGGTA